MPAFKAARVEIWSDLIRVGLGAVVGCLYVGNTQLAANFFAFTAAFAGVGALLLCRK